jgi:hypothetical protein
MRSVPRLGLLCATLALPVGAALVNHVLGDDPLPVAPAEVRIGESRDHQGAVGQPATPPAPVAGRPTAANESPATRPATGARRPDEPASSGPTSEGVVPPAPPVVDDTGNAAKGKAKGRNVVVPGHPTPSRGANGSGG